MKRIKDNRGYKQRGMIYQTHDINKLKMHTLESLNHWITKALLFRMLCKMKHDVITEFEITGILTLTVSKIGYTSKLGETQI